MRYRLLVENGSRKARQIGTLLYGPPQIWRDEDVHSLKINEAVKASSHHHSHPPTPRHQKYRQNTFHNKHSQKQETKSGMAAAATASGGFHSQTVLGVIKSWKSLVYQSKKIFDAWMHGTAHQELDDGNLWWWKGCRHHHQRRQLFQPQKYKSSFIKMYRTFIVDWAGELFISFDLNR